MERINGNELTPNTMYCMELDNDSLRQYGAYKLKHYGKFIKYNNNNTRAYFENIKNIKNNKNGLVKEGNGYRIINGVYWKFFKMKKDIIENRIINSLIQQITGEKYFKYL